jgi:hypothetical protein
MSGHSLVTAPKEYGNALSFWVEYPSGLVDLSRSQHLPTSPREVEAKPPPLKGDQVDIPVDGGHTVRIDTKATAAVIIDMQKFVPAYLWT